jgi:hypothetical protein
MVYEVPGLRLRVLARRPPAPPPPPKHAPPPPPATTKYETVYGAISANLIQVVDDGSYHSGEPLSLLYLTIPELGLPGRCAVVPEGKSKKPVEEVVVS